MKKTTLYLLILIMSISFFPNTMTAAGNPSNTPVAKPIEVPAHVQVQLDRLNEIKAMDKLK